MGTSHSNCVAAILRSWYLYDHIEQYVYQFGLSPISLGAARVVLSGVGYVSLNLPGPPVSSHEHQKLTCRRCHFSCLR